MYPMISSLIEKNAFQFSINLYERRNDITQFNPIKHQVQPGIGNPVIPQQVTKAKRLLLSGLLLFGLIFDFIK